MNDFCFWGSEMFSAFETKTAKPMVACRRKGKRIPLPVEVKIEVAGRTISGIVRDITIDKESVQRVTGISLMHFEPLSVRREYVCRPVESQKQLPEMFTVSVRWCRYFEDEAFISGGVILR